MSSDNFAIDLEFMHGLNLLVSLIGLKYCFETNKNGFYLFHIHSHRNKMLGLSFFVNFGELFLCVQLKDKKKNNIWKKKLNCKITKIFVYD